MKKTTFSRSRRNFLGAAAVGTAASMLPIRSAFAAPQPDYRLICGEYPVRLADEPFPKTKLWCFNGVTPGPEIRVKQGEKVRIAVQNNLQEITGIHWHGLRIPNEMDGVPFLTQPAIEVGEEFIYEYAPPDAGTYWYHSHQNAAIQMGRGLHGPLIVEERDPIRVDRDITWVLDDWRLDKDAQIENTFSDITDFSRGGRLGNTITLNGQLNSRLEVKAGERVRLRIINSSNARIYSLRFQDHKPQVIAVS